MEGVTLVMCPGTSSSTSMVGVKISIAKISHTKILLEVRKFSLEMHLGGNAGDGGRFDINEVRVLKGLGSKRAVSITKHCWKKTILIVVFL